MIPKKPAPDLIRGGSLFSEEIMLEHDPEKWIPVFRKDHAPPKI